jgi:hypothetical protein
MIGQPLTYQTHLASLRLVLLAQTKRASIVPFGGPCHEFSGCVFAGLGPSGAPIRRSILCSILRTSHRITLGTIRRPELTNARCSRNPRSATSPAGFVEERSVASRRSLCGLILDAETPPDALKDVATVTPHSSGCLIESRNMIF